MEPDLNDDAQETMNKEPWEEAAEILERGVAEELRDFLERLPPGESARAMSRLDEQDRARLLELLGPEDAAALIDNFSDAQAADIIEDLSPQHAAAILDELSSDEQADILGELPDADAEAILEHMGSKEATEARVLLHYPPDTAGGIMVTEYIAYPETFRVADVLDDLRQFGEQYADIDVQYAYIVSDDDILVGVLRFRDLILAKPEQPVSEIMIRNPVCVMADASLQEVALFFDEHSFLGVPVVDESGRLLGVVRRADVEEAAEEFANEQFLKVAGLIGEDELRSMSVRTRASRRLSWLSINIILNLVSASVIAFFQDTLRELIALAVFLPIISDMSGCSGNQAVAVSLRELTMGLIKPYEVLRVFMKELTVGLINGLALGILLALVCILWQRDPHLGVVVGAAMMLNTVVAVCLGGLIPLVLKGLKLDPALASGPLLTTVTDMCGFLFVLGFASIMLSWFRG